MKLIKKEFSESYRKKWNVYMDDYVQLVDDNNIVSNSVYRKSGFFNESDLNDPYFMLLKYFEEYYDDGITKEKKKKPHLTGKWCILDKNGVEKKVFEEFVTVWLVKNSVLYSVNGKYYNIETGECYGDASIVIESENFIILENRYSWLRDNDKKLGVFKINKKTGVVELIDKLR